MRKVGLGWVVLLIMLLQACTTTEVVIFPYLNPGVDTVEVNSLWVDAGAKATVNARVKTMEVISNTVDITKVGTYEVVYEITSGGKSAHIRRLITIKDETPPVISLNPGVDTIYRYQNWVDAFVQVSDNSKQAVLIQISGEVNSHISGEYMITYIATDSSGNQAQVVRYVTVLPT